MPRGLVQPSVAAGAGLRWRLAADRHATASLELAFLAPVLVLLLFGVIELSRFLYAQGTLQSATATVLRAATIDRTLSEAGARTVFMRQLTGVDPAIVGSFTLTRTDDGGSSLERVTIRVEATFIPILPGLLQGGIAIETELEGFTTS